tara:strand:+ start:194 stop:463 length:270 start_codon:yes stop_codon:yes gene_type:complete
MVACAVWIANGTGSNRKVNLMHVPADETPDDKFALLDNASIRGEAHTQLEAPIVLNPGEALYARADAVSAIAMTIYIVPADQYFGGALR